MSVVLIVLLGVLLFGALIAVHELGHFLTAKLCGVKVNEFSIGMGPALLSRQGRETRYALRLFPIGGYCAMEGEDEDTPDPRSFQKAKTWKKLVILVAGALCNFLVGFLLFLGLCAARPDYYVDAVVSLDQAPELAAQGLEVGDEFLRVDGHAVLINGDAPLFLSRAGDRADLEVRRNGQRVLLEDVDLRPAFRVPLSQTVGVKVYPASLGDKIGQGWRTSVAMVRLVWMSLGDLVTGSVGIRDISGPVGIVSVMGEVAQESETAGGALRNVLYLVAFIAVNLAVMNLLPIPALDGGRVFFLLVGAAFTAVTRRRLDPKYEGAVNAVFFVALLLFMAVVAVSDILKLFGR